MSIKIHNVLSKAHRNKFRLGSVFNIIIDFISMLKDRKSFKLDPLEISIICVALSYFFMPNDLIPDFLPIGLIDDVLIVMSIATSLSELLKRYRNWKRSITKNGKNDSNKTREFSFDLEIPP
jgi:uncharacterized membrane protein YkvA (DUF1232 family)